MWKFSQRHQPSIYHVHYERRRSVVTHRHISRWQKLSHAIRKMRQYVGRKVYPERYELPETPELTPEDKGE